MNRPGRYPPPLPVFPPDPEADFSTAAARAAVSLMERAAWLERPVLRGRDPEALHQWRLCWRRLISLRDMTRACGDIRSGPDKAIGRALNKSNALRDRDVLIEAAAGRPLLRHYLATARRIRQQRLARWLLSARRRNDLLTIRAWRDELPRRLGKRPLTATSLSILAGWTGELRSAFRGALTGGEKDRHRLRIMAKRLRYGTELARQLMPAGTTETALKRLRGLQTALGRSRDASLQTAYLRRLAEWRRRFLPGIRPAAAALAADIEAAAAAAAPAALLAATDLIYGDGPARFRSRLDPWRHRV